MIGRAGIASNAATLRVDELLDITLTGGTVTEQEHRAVAAAGRAFLKGAAYVPPHEEPSEDYSLLYTTGRTVYQFHTRTKTGRSRSLHEAAPDAWVELSVADAERYGIAAGPATVFMFSLA